MAYPFRLQDESIFARIDKQFNEKLTQPIVEKYWHWCFYISAVYVTAVLLGQKYMENKKPYQLRRVLCMWNAGLSAFSFWALSRVFGEMRLMVQIGGFQHAVCDGGRAFVGSTGNAIWAYLFAFSKLPELFDTAFIVLRKQKLSFLHVYHHITVFIYCWYSYTIPQSTGIWFGYVNYTVHALMYLYYAIRASGRQLPRWIARTITTIQISQMFVGLFIIYVAGDALSRGKYCQTNWFNITMALLMYTSYVILFGNFYYWTYVFRKPKSEGKAPTETGLPAAKVTSNGHLNGVVPNGSAQTVRERR